MTGRGPRLLLAAFLALSGSSQAQNPLPQTGSVFEPGCAAPASLEWVAEASFVERDARGGAADSLWLADLTNKGGFRAGLSEGDITGNSYQALWPHGSDWPSQSPVEEDFLAWSHHALFTFPDGRIGLDASHPDASYFSEQGSVEWQRVGDSPPPARPPTAGVLLPDGDAPYFADLGRGRERFPRLDRGWPEIAIAPLVERNDSSVDGCTLGGEAVDAATGRELIIGYDLYRIADSGSAPAPSELGRAVNWLDFIPVDPATWDGPLLSRLSDPDGLPQSGDEVLLYTDAPETVDGAPRPHGVEPLAAPGERYWYGVAPVIEGELANWFARSVALGPIADHSSDSDGDGSSDSVDLDRDGRLDLTAFGDAHGVRGLGLTYDSSPLLSKLILLEPAGLDAIVGPGLRLGPGGLLTWNASGGSDRIRRSDRRDFLRRWPIPSLSTRIGESSDGSFLDEELPGPGSVFYYHVSAVTASGDEMGD